MYISVTVFTAVAAVFDFLKALPASLVAGMHLDGVIKFARGILPWFDLNLGWVVPAIVGLVVGLVIRTVRKNK